MDTEKIIQSRVWTVALVIIGGLVVLCLGFWLGSGMAYRRADYSMRWGDNYHQLFAGPPRGFFDDFEGRPFMDAHGIDGTILKIDSDVLVIKDDNTEKNVAVTTTTSIRRGRDDLKLTDLHVNDHVVIIGAPNPQGQVDAKLIRVFPN